MHGATLHLSVVRSYSYMLYFLTSCKKRPSRIDSEAFFQDGACLSMDGLNKKLCKVYTAG